MFWIWSSAIRRCHDPRTSAFKNYGGRGIEVCDRWRKDFWAFVADMGPRPSAEHTLERIENDKGYLPTNVRWATRREQSRNKRNTVRITIDGRTQTMADWAREVGLWAATIHSRLRRGWSARDAVSRPSSRRR
jgi:hypothetical protein